MERVLKRPQLVDILSERTGFYKKNINEILDALDDVIVENMSAATKTEPSEVHLSLGFVFGGRYSPKKQAVDPRDGSTITVKAKYIPYAKFKPSFRKKINKK
jgi:nucleoid DNA-binding protein